MGDCEYCEKSGLFVLNGEPVAGDTVATALNAHEFRVRLAQKRIDKIEFALRRIGAMSWGADTNSPCADDAAETMQDIATEALLGGGK